MVRSCRRKVRLTLRAEEWQLLADVLRNTAYLSWATEDEAEDIEHLLGKMDRFLEEVEEGGR